MQTVVDLPVDEQARKEASDWLVKMSREQGLSDVELSGLEAWLASDPLHRKKLHELAFLHGQIDLITGFVDARVERQAQSQIKSFKRICYPLAAAATALVIAISFGMWRQSANENSQQGRYATGLGEQQSIELVDGSTVLLNTQSELKVNFVEGNRDIHLQRGEAYFIVAKDEESPFRVFAGNSSIRASGTAFLVYLDEELVDVTVTDGVVNLALLPEKVDAGSAISPDIVATNLATLRKGQAATITPPSEGQQVLSELRTVSDQDLTKKLFWTRGALLFSGETLGEVVSEINRYSDVDIAFASPELAAIRVGGLFPVGEMDSFYRALESNFGVQVTRVSESRIVLSASNNP